MTTGEGTVRTTCPYCGVGCGVSACHRNGRLLAVSGDPDHPANHGRLCVKGSTLPETQTDSGRLLHPMVGTSRVGWNDALDLVAERFAATIRQHGPDAVALYLSGQLLTEDYYVANKLMKGFVGSANVDTNSRLCMASAVAAHKRAFGEDVVPCDYDDLERCELLVLVGSNAAWAHPVLYQRIAARRERGELKVVVIDPRRTATCDIADLHLPLRPGSDVALFNALLARLADGGQLNDGYLRDHTSGWVETLAAARRDARQAESATALATADLATFFELFARSPRVVTLFSQGVNQASNGTDKANAIINCHLATGRIGRPGAGPFSITGQPNAMGGREVGGMASQLAAHGDFEADDIQRLQRFWGSRAVAGGPGRKAVELFEAIGRGDIRAVWILGTNPVVSLPRANRVRAALNACPFVVVSDCVARTDTTACADVLLPAAGWGEKDGTVTNSERRISRQRGFLPLPGEARPDWWALCQVATRLGFGAAFDYAGPWQIFREHAELSKVMNRGRRLFDLGALAALDRPGYDALTPVQWPLASADGPNRPFADGRFPTADGRARLVPVTHRRPAQQADADHPFILNTGRLRDQWHTMTRTGVAPKLFGHADTPALQINPADARRLGVQPGDLLEARNAGGCIRAIAEVTARVAAGSLFYPMHWNDRFAHPCRVGALIDAATDPESGQPESKHGAVALSCRPMSTWLRLVSAQPLPPGLLCQAAFWCQLPIDGGWRSELAFEQGLAADRLDAARQALQYDNAIDFTDPARGDHRLLLETDGRVTLIGFGAPHRDRLPAASLLVTLLATDAGPRWQRLAGTEAGDADTSPAVCTCFGVSAGAIRTAIAAGARDARSLGQQLRCGTNCGSCVPELNALIEEAAG